MSRRELPALTTDLDRAFAELAPIPAARRVYCATNTIAHALRTLAAEWLASGIGPLQTRAPGMLEAARAFEAEVARAMAEVSK